MNKTKTEQKESRNSSYTHKEFLQRNIDIKLHRQRFSTDIYQTDGKAHIDFKKKVNVQRSQLNRSVVLCVKVPFALEYIYIF